MSQSFASVMDSRYNIPIQIISNQEEKNLQHDSTETENNKQN